MKTEVEIRNYLRKASSFAAISLLHPFSALAALFHMVLLFTFRVYRNKRKTKLG